MKPPRPTRAFTLLELLVVIGLVGALTYAFLSGWNGGGNSAAIKSAQASLGSIITAARVRALASGADVRVLVQVDAASPLADDRFLRYLVLQTASGSDWTTVGEVTLPPSTGILPRDPSSYTDLLSTGENWTRPSDNGALRSSAFRTSSSFADAEFSAAINSSISERWAALKFGARGTTSSSGALVIGLLQKQPQANGSAGFQFKNAEVVRGISISGYGLASYVDERAGF